MSWAVLKFSEIIWSNFTADTSWHSSEPGGPPGGFRWNPSYLLCLALQKLSWHVSLWVGQWAQWCPCGSGWYLLPQQGKEIWSAISGYKGNKEVSTFSGKDLSPGLKTLPVHILALPVVTSAGHWPCPPLLPWANLWPYRAEIMLRRGMCLPEDSGLSSLYSPLPSGSPPRGNRHNYMGPGDSALFSDPWREAWGCSSPGALLITQGVLI